MANVFLVHQDDLLRHALVAILEEAGHSVIAIDETRPAEIPLGAPVDLAIFGQGALTISARLRAERPFLPILAITDAERGCGVDQATITLSTRSGIAEFQRAVTWLLLAGAAIAGPGDGAQVEEGVKSRVH